MQKTINVILQSLGKRDAMKTILMKWKARIAISLPNRTGEMPSIYNIIKHHNTTKRQDRKQ